MQRTTEKWGETPKIAVRTLKADVVEGPDSGRSTWTSDERLTLGTAKGNDLVLGDETVSRFHLLVKRTDDGILLVDQRSTNGTFVGAARLGEATVTPGTVITLGRTRVRLAHGQDTDVELHDEASLGPLYGSSVPMRRVMAWVRRAAASDASVLLSGESGTGKDVVARAIHQLGARAAMPFVTVDCGALAPSLVASELFGHERGAFTGAIRDKPGRFEMAQGGTLFLDDIDDVPLSMQVKLLRVLQNRTIERLGGTRTVPVNVRVLAGSKRDVKQMVAEGKFREDLFYRLNVVPITLPPLRARREDVALLAQHFVQKSCKSNGVPPRILSQATLRALMDHLWPGNIRQLENAIEHAVAMSGSAAEITPAMLPEDVRSPGQTTLLSPVTIPDEGLSFTSVVSQLERELILRSLEKTGGNKRQAARLLNLSRTTLIDKLQRLGGAEATPVDDVDEAAAAV